MGVEIDPFFFCCLLGRLHKRLAVSARRIGAGKKEWYVIFLYGNDEPVLLFHLCQKRICERNVCLQTGGQREEMLLKGGFLQIILQGNVPEERGGQNERHDQSGA